MKYLEAYAKLLVVNGINIQKNQILVIRAQINDAEFVRAATKVAYEAGAKEVVVYWSDTAISRMTYQNAPLEVFENVPEWIKHFFNDYAEQDAAILSFTSADPEAYKGIDSKVLDTYSRAHRAAISPFQTKLMNNGCAWCVAAAPSVAWAKKVYPDLSDKDAYDCLWLDIVKATRADQEDPVKAWDEHQAHLNERLDFLHKANLKYLHYKNSKGTDLTIELPKGHIWVGGSEEHTGKHYPFMANIPTEEVFTLPKADGVNGKVYATMPLAHNGMVISDMWFEFKDGRIINYGASKNQEILKNMIETDEGSHYLGEVALVPFDSPISNMKTLFFNTLFDENASCHLAIGKAYPTTLEGGASMNDQELKAHGVNQSLVHTDFMIGSSDMSIIGINEAGDEIPVFVNGNFAFEN